MHGQNHIKCYRSFDINNQWTYLHVSCVDACLEWSSKENSFRFQCWKWRLVVPLGSYFPNPAGKGTPSLKDVFRQLPRYLELRPYCAKCATWQPAALSESLRKQIYDLALRHVCAWRIKSAVLYKLRCFVAGPATFLDQLIVIQLVEKLSDIYGIQKCPRACCWPLSWAACL